MSLLISERIASKKEDSRLYSSPLKTSDNTDTKMQTIVSALPILRNGLRTTTPMILKTASITTLKLNTQPLPKQPVPDLKETAQRYLKSIKPLLNDQEYNTTTKIVEKFCSTDGIGPKLHSKLLERFNNTDNWLSDWWLRTAYLGYRVPVIVHSSPGSVGTLVKLSHPDDFYTCSAQVIQAVCNFDKMVKSGQMKQEMARNDPLDMQPYGMILGTHRRPAKNVDQLLHTDDAKHIVIICNNHFYKLSIASEAEWSDDGILAATIKDIVQRSSAEAIPVGILTGNDRDTWAEVHSSLLGIGSNRNIIKDIENSLFILCIDKNIPENVFKGKNRASVRALQTLTGISRRLNAGNRWHDKTIQFIVTGEGFIGMEYEHSPCEGVPVAVLYDFVHKFVTSKESNARRAPPAKFPRAELLKFEVNKNIETAIEKAAESVDKLSNDLDLECFVFEKFGSNAIKQIKFSPDSFIQIAMQVAYYKMHKKPPAHYESAALRRFQNARTECIRSTSTASVEFAKMMLSNQSDAEKKKAMEAAIKAHKQLVAEAVSGNGVDRHLFGLKMIAMSESKEVPELFKDVGFTRSTAFTLSTSQVPYKTAAFMCFGPVVPNGYGCCYNPRGTEIFFSCSSFKSSPETNSKYFAQALEESLWQMKELGSQ